MLVDLLTLVVVVPVGAAAFCSLNTLAGNTQRKIQRQIYSCSEYFVARSTVVPTSPRSLPFLFSSTDGSNENNGESESPDRLSLEDTLVWIEALEERNKAQLMSFIDEEDQWESLQDWERELLLSKEKILRQLDELTE